VCGRQPGRQKEGIKGVLRSRKRREKKGERVGRKKIKG